MIDFKTRLKELREEKGLTQDELAKVFNLTQQSVSKWEKGIREPNFTMLEQLCKYFDCTSDYLLGLSEY